MKPSQHIAKPEKKEAPLTPGEKFYEALQFSVGKVTIMAFTAALAYTAKYGKDNWGKIPNVLKKFQGWANDRLMHNKIMPLSEKGEFGERLAGATANTCVLWYGGTMFGPIMKWMENSHESIANYVNRQVGTLEDVKIAHERLKDKPKQTWGDILKGRMAAWALVFTAFTGIDTVIGKDKKTGMYWFDKYEEGFARKLAGFSKGGKELSKVPLTQKLNAAQDVNKLYRFGKILALDFFATSAAIIVWNAVSRDSAKKRKEQNLAAVGASQDPVIEEATLGIPAAAAVAPATNEPGSARAGKYLRPTLRLDPAHHQRTTTLHEHIAAHRQSAELDPLSV